MGRRRKRYLGPSQAEIDAALPVLEQCRRTVIRLTYDMRPFHESYLIADAVNASITRLAKHLTGSEYPFGPPPPAHMSPTVGWKDPAKDD